VNIVEPQLRSAAPEDAVTIAALAIQVFLDTYATEGVRPDLAVEAFTEYSLDAFASRLQEPTRRFLLAEQASGLIGFAELQVAPVSAPAGAVVGAELVRLYVQPRFQRRGVGRRLLQEAELAAAAAALGGLWLTAWEGNRRACTFYASLGYQDIGATTYCFQGNSYGNRVFVKHFSTRTGPA
jgi:ribosomal protein S18 acetylase RimI-like enzyme